MLTMLLSKLLQLSIIFIFSNATKVFTIKNTVSPTIIKGFGSVTNIKSVQTPAELESHIQHTICGERGLQEAMQLHDEVGSYENSLKKMNIIQRTQLPLKYVNEMKIKSLKLTEAINNGWTRNNVQKKLQEITWDASASIRENRHKELRESIEKNVFDHMNNVAKLVLHLEVESEIINPFILDVGCGTGVIFQYLRNQSSYFPTITENRWHGIDLSREMIKISRINYPNSTFYHQNFLEFNNINNNNSNTNKNTNVKYDTIIFNECIHNFMNITEVLLHAKTLLSSSIDARIILSHPRGYQNVVKQNSKNRWLAPNLLPTELELNKICEYNQLKLTLAPDLKSSNYLVILKHN